MNRLILLSACLILLCGCSPAAPKSNASFYVQLIHGADDDVAAGDHVKPVGPKLRNKLQCAFKWTHYWEIKRDVVTVPPGRKVRDMLNAEQAVEIELLPAERVAVRVYTGGRLVRSRQQPVDNAFCVTGAPMGDNQSWFIVVRRDDPSAVGGY